MEARDPIGSSSDIRLSASDLPGLPRHGRGYADLSNMEHHHLVEAGWRSPAKPAAGRFARQCDIRLTLPATAENVALVRHVVGALAEALHMPESLVEDVKLAVTEACTNVVRHAYGAEHEGPLDVAAAPAAPGSLTIVVTDRGRGMQPNPHEDGPGFGLPLIAALASQVEIEHEAGNGSRVRMSFEAAGSLETA